MELMPQHPPLAPAWPPNRFEVRWELPGGGVESDGYHFADWAREAARRAYGRGMARNVHVVRLDDGVVVFDPSNEVELPVEEW
ncbi:hypothetical protein DP939_15240 [Spongiactinospora rosea]|uniref:Uncharacterized protein n=2 Tax=Spongiactinospora rosea TaxID=2248750 RepID=A0A366LZ95_9ACTN|nr:hypothetical protein DP939_15240 [Spongiactinospora rosea]